MPRLASPDPEACRFGAIVRRLREAHGWTLADFAQKAKMNRTYLAVLERGENVPSLSVVLHLARVLCADAAAMVAEVVEGSKRKHG